VSNRREFITLLGGAAAWPVAARGQEPAVPVIGLLSPRSPAVDAPLIAVIRQGLSDVGFVEGRNVVFDYRWADGRYDRLTALAADLVRRPVAVIVAIGGDTSAPAAKAATSSIPIVFIGAADPVRIGLVTSLHHPGGNITGVSSFLVEVEPKKLGLLRELRPRAATIAVLVNPNFPNAERQVSDIETAASSVGQKIDILKAESIGAIDAAFAKLAQIHTDALLVAADSLFFNRAAQLVVLAARHAIPTLYFRREFTASGGLMSYGSNADEHYRVTGVYAGRILKGEKPGDLPVQLPTKYELVINLSTARTLNIEVPPTLLARADEVIE
jgi:putative ABC transport system substrate-binding protein